jgi:hypothetical protein
VARWFPNASTLSLSTALDLPLLREIQFFGDVLAFEIPSAIRFRNASGPLARERASFLVREKYFLNPLSFSFQVALDSGSGRSAHA